MRKEFYSNLCIKSITGNITETEQAILTKWLNESYSNKKEYELLQLSWNRIAYNEEKNLPNMDIEWNKLNYRINIEKKRTDYKIKWYRSIPDILFKPIYKPAIAVIVLIILVAFYVSQIKDELVSIKSVSTNPGEKKTIILSDGSSVLLNYSSKIEYPREFSEIREVQLNGEAFFSVKKDAKRFKIKTTNAVVTVLGTKFAIKSRDARTEIFVEEGKVNLKTIELKSTGG